MNSKIEYKLDRLEAENSTMREALIKVQSELQNQLVRLEILGWTDGPEQALWSGLKATVDAALVEEPIE